MKILFGLTLIIIVIMRICNSRNQKMQNGSAEYWEKERRSHFVPSKNLDSLPYLTIPYSELPFTVWTPGNDGGEPVSLGTSDIVSEESGLFADSASEEFRASLSEELSAVEHDLCSLFGKRILNLGGQSNADLRLAYGTNNLEPLSVYDENFSSLIRLLQKWGSLLLRLHREADAVTVLSYAISVGSDIAATYDTLTNLYVKSGDFEKIKELRASAEQLNTLMKQHILDSLDKALGMADLLAPEEDDANEES